LGPISSEEGREGGREGGRDGVRKKFREVMMKQGKEYPHRHAVGSNVRGGKGGRGREGRKGSRMNIALAK